MVRGVQGDNLPKPAARKDVSHEKGAEEYDNYPDEALYNIAPSRGVNVLCITSVHSQSDLTIALFSPFFPGGKGEDEGIKLSNTP